MIAAKRLSYSEEVIRTPSGPHWVAGQSALPPRGLSGRISAIDLAEGAMKTFLMKPEQLE